MNLNNLIRIGDAVELIADQTDAYITDIVNSLIGVCWDEEEAGEIINYLWDEGNI